MHGAEILRLTGPLAPPQPIEGAEAMVRKPKESQPVEGFEATPGGGIRIGRAALEWGSPARIGIIAASLLTWLFISEVVKPVAAAVVTSINAAADAQKSLAEAVKISNERDQKNDDSARRANILQEANTEAMHSLKDEVRILTKRLDEFLSRK